MKLFPPFSTSYQIKSVRFFPCNLSTLFADRGGKGSHRNFKHESGVKITISGRPGDDAKPYQEKDVKKAIEESKS